MAKNQMLRDIFWALAITATIIIGWIVLPIIAVMLVPAALLGVVFILVKIYFEEEKEKTERKITHPEE